VYTVDTGDSMTPAADTLFGTRLALHMQVLSLHHSHIVSPRILNMFSVGFSRAAYNIDSVPQASFAPGLSFVTGAGPGGITIGGGTTGAAITGAGASNSNVWNRRNLFTYTDSLKIASGRNQIR